MLYNTAYYPALLSLIFWYGTMYICQAPWFQVVIP